MSSKLGAQPTSSIPALHDKISEMAPTPTVQDLRKLERDVNKLSFRMGIRAEESEEMGRELMEKKAEAAKVEDEKIKTEESTADAKKDSTD